MKRTSGPWEALPQQLDDAAGYVEPRMTVKPRVGVVLGSGLGGFADGLLDSTMIESKEIPHYPRSTVHGHRGRLVCGMCCGVPVIALQGRVHFYEGYPIQKVAFPIHLLNALGIRDLVLTNAAGGINTRFSPGDFMIITDHINTQFQNPLMGPNHEQLGPRFPDMSAAYYTAYADIAEEAALRLGIVSHRGVLCAATGPTYETAAEIQFLSRIGADAVSMSTIPEAIAAAFLRLRVLGISCITNMATGVTGNVLSHDEVTAVADRIGDRFSKLLTECIAGIDTHRATPSRDAEKSIENGEPTE